VINLIEATSICRSSRRNVTYDTEPSIQDMTVGEIIEKSWVTTKEKEDMNPNFPAFCEISTEPPNVWDMYFYRVLSQWHSAVALKQYLHTLRAWLELSIRSQVCERHQLKWYRSKKRDESLLRDEDATLVSVPSRRNQQMNMRQRKSSTSVSKLTCRHRNWNISMAPK